MSDYGIPQNRKRVIIIGLNRDYFGKESKSIFYHQKDSYKVLLNTFSLYIGIKNFVSKNYLKIFDEISLFKKWLLSGKSSYNTFKNYYLNQLIFA